MKHCVKKSHAAFKILSVIGVSFIVSFFLSCYSFTRSWGIPERGKIAGTVKISVVEADMNGMRSSVEDETACLLPLLLSDLNYLTVKETANADFLAEVKLREREYISGWKTVNSVSVEIHFRPGRKTIIYDAGISVPLASGYAVSEGGVGLSSSRILHTLLQSALAEAVRSLEKL